MTSLPRRCWVTFSGPTQALKYHWWKRDGGMWRRQQMWSRRWACYHVLHHLLYRDLQYTILHKTLSVLQKFSGSLEAMIRSANGNAWSLVEVVASSFASYRDVTSYNRQSVSFLKRAQLFASDLCHVLGGRSFSALKGIDKLTMFADYRVPQVSTKHPSCLVFVGMFEICFP